MKNEQENIENSVVSTPEEIFVRKLEKFDSFYLQLVVLCAVVAAATVAVSIIANALVGLAVAVALALIYAYFSRDELKRSLGVVCTVNNASLRITQLTSAIETDAFVPSRIMWYDVTEIAHGVLENEKIQGVERLHIPSTVKRIEKGAFDGCDSLQALLFACGEDELEKMSVEEDLSRFTLKFGVPFPEKKKGGCAK